jgi:hypothetical protein
MKQLILILVLMALPIAAPADDTLMVTADTTWRFVDVGHGPRQLVPVQRLVEYTIARRMLRVSALLTDTTYQPRFADTIPGSYTFWGELVARRRAYLLHRKTTVDTITDTMTTRRYEKCE